MTARRLMNLALLASLAWSMGVACAQQSPVEAYPTKPIHLIVNFPPGGTVDALARIMAEKLSLKWSQAVVVDNRPGAGGNIGAQLAATAEPDGYVLLVTPPGALSINQYLYKDMGFDPEKLTPVILLANVPNAITARVGLPVNTVEELIEYVKHNPGKVTYASQGNGSTSHLTGQMFATMISGQMLHIPFRGEGPALNDLLAGRVDLFFGNISAVLKFQQANRVKILGVASSRPSSAAPNVPPLAHGALADFSASAWFAIAAPPGTPAALVDKLNAASQEILQMPDVRKQFAAQGADVMAGSPADMARFVSSERRRWKTVIDTAGVTIE